MNVSKFGLRQLNQVVSRPVLLVVVSRHLMLARIITTVDFYIIQVLAQRNRDDLSVISDIMHSVIVDHLHRVSIHFDQFTDRNLVLAIDALADHVDALVTFIGRNRVNTGLLRKVWVLGYALDVDVWPIVV